MPTIVANADGSYTITVPAPVAPTPPPASPTEAAVQAAVDTAIEGEFTPPVV